MQRYFIFLITCIACIVQMSPAQWQLQTTLDGNPPLYSICAVNDKVVWMGSFDTVYRTTDGGLHWVPTAQTPTSSEAIVCIEALSSDVAFVGGGGPDILGGDAQIYRTTDGGQTWSVQYTAAGPGSYWNAIHFFDSLNAIAMSDPPDTGDSFLIVTSTDAGETWVPITNQPVPNSGEYGLQHMFFYDSLYGWFGTGLSDTSGSAGRVFRTTDGGNTWTGFPSGNTETVGGVHFVSRLVGIRTSYSSPALTRTTDGGQTWVPVTGLPIPDGSPLFSVTGVNTSSANQMWVVGGTPTGQAFILTSIDGGEHWDQQVLPALSQFYFPWLSAVSFGAQNDSVQAFGAILNIATFDRGGQVLSYRQSIGSVTGIGDQTDLPTGFKLSQNYPNPFNPSTIIRYQLPIDNYVTLKVYDLLGREVAVLVDGRKSAGSHEVTWNAPGSASGLYLYRIEAYDDNRRSFVQTRKMLLVR